MNCSLLCLSCRLSKTSDPAPHFLPYIQLCVWTSAHTLSTNGSFLKRTWPREIASQTRVIWSFSANNHCCCFSSMGLHLSSHSSDGLCNYSALQSPWLYSSQSTVDHAGPAVPTTECSLVLHFPCQIKKIRSQKKTMRVREIKHKRGRVKEEGSRLKRETTWRRTEEHSVLINVFHH